MNVTSYHDLPLGHQRTNLTFSEISWYFFILNDWSANVAIANTFLLKSNLSMMHAQGYKQTSHGYDHLEKINVTLASNICCASNSGDIH